MAALTYQRALASLLLIVILIGIGAVAMGGYAPSWIWLVSLAVTGAAVAHIVYSRPWGDRS